MLSLRSRLVPSSNLPTRHLAVKPFPCVNARRRFLSLPAAWGRPSGIGGRGDGNLPFGCGGGGCGDDDGYLPCGRDGDGNILFGGGGGGGGGGGNGKIRRQRRRLRRRRWQSTFVRGGGGGGGDGNITFRGPGDGNISFRVGGGGGGDGNIPFDGGDGGGGDIASGGDEDDVSIEGFRVLDSNEWIRYLPQHGAFKAPLLANNFFSAKVCEKNQDKMECQSSRSMHVMNLEGAEASSYDGKNDEKHAVPPIVLNNTMDSTGNYSYKNSGPETVSMRATKSLVRSVDIGIPDDENVSDENENKMKGRRGFSFNIAVGSLAYSMALIPYWTFCCSNTPLGIFGTWMDILPTAHAVVTISSLLLVGAASHFKEGELPDNYGFKFLKIVQFLVFLWLWAASFIPLRVCRGTPNSVVWPFASAALCMVVLSWIAVFQRTETMFEKVPQWLRNLSLPECITAKFKKVQEKQRGPNPPMQMV